MVPCLVTLTCLQTRRAGLSALVDILVISANGAGYAVGFVCLCVSVSEQGNSNKLWADFDRIFWTDGSRDREYVVCTIVQMTRLGAAKLHVPPKSNRFFLGPCATVPPNFVFEKID